MSLLFTLTLVFGPTDTVYSGTAHRTEVTITDVELNDDLDWEIRWNLQDNKHKDEDIFIKSLQIKQAEFEVDYYDAMEDDYEYLTITLNGNYESLQSMKKDIETAVLKQQANINIADLYDYLVFTKLICDVEYKYKEELIIGEELGLPCTVADGKYELSPLTLYIARCRVSYVIEDGGEFYIPEDDYDFFTWQSHIGAIGDASWLEIQQEAYFNLDWKCFKSAGTVVGELNKVDKNHTVIQFTKKDRYVIGHLAYYKLSDIIEDWSTENRALFQYDKSTKTLYYGKKPLAKDKLQKDEIYDFVKKVTQGCTTDKQKLQAIYDAMVKKYNVYESMFSLASFSGYVMRDNLYDAKTLMVYKQDSYNSFADFFKECCNRLLIPCDLVNDSYLYWNRVYLGDKIYHVDTGTEAIIYHQSNAKEPSRQFFLKTSYEFMGTHVWEGDDYTPEKFSKTWKNINRNNIKTTDELRRAASYASYLCKDGKKRTYTFKITGKKVNTYCEAYVYQYGYISNIKASYKKGILTITYN